MRIVLASDKFKGSLDAAGVAAALDEGLRRALPEVRTVRVPVADGGDGTLAACADADFTLCAVDVEGPTGEPVSTAYARRGDVAVVELADASGLSRLASGPAPLDASTIGTGQAVAAAVAAGCHEVVLGVGGSASTDGGLGLVQGLGAVVLDRHGRSVPPGTRGLAMATHLDLDAVRERLDGVAVTLACDVDNPLLGPYGAAAVYAPQKGGSPDDVAFAEQALRRWADLVADTVGADHRDVAGSGAAGGTGFAALALLGARRRSGIEVVLDLVGFDAALGGADLVVTGEGSLDAQSLHGKAPVGVARRAVRAGIPVVAVCGRTTLTSAEARSAGLDRVYALTDREPDVGVCVAEAARLLAEVGASIGADRAGSPRDPDPLPAT